MNRAPSRVGPRGRCSIDGVKARSPSTCPRTLGCGLFFACLLMSSMASARDEARPLPDQAAINEVLQNAVRPNMRYVSSRAVSHYLRSRLALEDGNVDTAAAELSLSSVYDPVSVWPRYAMARDKLGRGQKAEAETNVRIALQIDDEHVPSLLLRARMLIDEGDMERAVEVLSEAARADASDPRPLVLLTRVLVQIGQLESAQAQMKRLDSVLAPGNDGPQWAGAVRDAAADTSLALAQALERVLRDEAADFFFRRSLAMAEQTVTRMDAYVAFLESRHRAKEAAALAEQTLAYGAPNATRVLRAAGLHLAASRPDAAVAYVPLLASVSGAEDTALVELGARLLKEREPARALVAFEAALALGPENNDARGYEALALEVLGRLDQAIHSYQRIFTDETVGDWARARAASCERQLATEAVLKGTQMADSSPSVRAPTAEATGALLSP